MQLLSQAKELCLAHHNAHELCMRYGTVKDDGTQGMKYSSGCFGGIASFTNQMKTEPYLYLPFHGDGCDLSFDELVDTVKYHEAMKAYPRDWNKFEGTSRSMTWVKFMTGVNSPWAELVKHLAETDLDYCNTAGFIFKGKQNLPIKLFYNFAMAIRWPWEMAQQYSTFLLLREKLEERIACYIAMNFELRQAFEDKKGATSLEDGPWDIIYPWSFLESTTLEAAGRFCLSKPGNLKTTAEEVTPNVFPLWGTEAVKADCWERAKKLSLNDKLTLAQIVEAVETSIKQAEASWEK